MKYNLADIDKFEKFIKEKYPNFHYTKDLISPMGNGCEQAFSIDEFNSVYLKCPSLFAEGEKKDRPYRCSGGISQCTISPNGKLKICNGACDSRFAFKYNAFEVGLVKAWYRGGKNIQFYRKERNKNTKKCNSCKFKSQCHVTDCRILALAYYGDEKLNSPIPCFTAKMSNKDK